MTKERAGCLLFVAVILLVGALDVTTAPAIAVLFIYGGVSLFSHDPGFQGLGWISLVTGIGLILMRFAEAYEKVR